MVPSHHHHAKKQKLPRIARTTAGFLQQEPEASSDILWQPAVNFPAGAGWISRVDPYKTHSVLAAACAKSRFVLEI